MAFRKLLSTFGLAVFLVFSFSGCVTKSGNLGIKDITVHEIDAKLIKGKSTQNDVLKLYGNPTSKTLDEKGSEKWTYSYTENRKGIIDFIPYASDGTSNEYRKSLFITFNRKTKLLSDYYVEEIGATQTKQEVSDGSSFDAGVK